ncbi:hypothetical protein KCU98_g212, partial [Aureobasidium melanogenum]
MGVRVPCAPEVVSPKRTSVSTALSKFPLTFFKTIELRRVSGKPISLSDASFVSNVSSSWFPTLDPNTRDGLFIFPIGGVERPSEPVNAGDSGGVNLCWVADEERTPSEKPNFFPGFGGRGGGTPSFELILAPPTV